MSKKETRQALIEVGLELINSAGYTATGINQILNAANARSFYNHFTSKDHFVAEVIKFYVAGVDEHMKRMLGERTVSPVQRLRLYFEEMIATHGRSNGPITGCLLGNLSLEVAGHNAEIRNLLRQSFDGWQRSIASAIGEAIDQGELPGTVDANDLAAAIVDSWEGAQVRAKAEQTDKALNLFFDSTFNVLLRADRHVHRN
jgi:TetR/AcrR family transcriptional regulator, transcriptional repressor for nem operon